MIFELQLWISYSTHIFERHGFSVKQSQKASLVMSLPQSILSIGQLLQLSVNFFLVTVAMAGERILLIWIQIGLLNR